MVLGDIKLLVCSALLIFGHFQFCLRMSKGSTLQGAGNASSWIQTTLMLEEYLDGPEVRDHSFIEHS